jgi:hypothetical protein
MAENKVEEIPPPMPDPAPLIPEVKNEEQPTAERSDLRFPEPVQHAQYDAEPEETSYRWICLFTFAFIGLITGAISSYYNRMEVLLVDVSIFFLIYRCSSNRFLVSTEFTWCSSSSIFLHHCLYIIQFLKSLEPEAPSLQVCYYQSSVFGYVFPQRDPEHLRVPFSLT